MPVEPRDVFIHHASYKEHEAALRLTDLLEAEGIACWIAPRDLPDGMDSVDVIPSVIEQCQVMVLMVSNSTLRAEGLHFALGLTAQSKTPLLPVCIEVIDEPLPLNKLLGGRRCVEAITGEEPTRFSNAVEAIRGILLNTGTPIPIRHASDLLTQAQALTQTLNESLGARFRNINAFFSVRAYSQEHFALHFPVRIGASCANILLECHAGEYKIRFYAELSAKGDPLRRPFRTVFERLFQPLLGDQLCSTETDADLSILRFLDLQLPKNALFTLPSESLIGLYNAYISIFCDKILPKLIDWIEYGRALQTEINRLLEALAEVFPETEGWCIDAKSRNAITDFRPIGSVDIFRKSWLPSDSYRQRGQLTLRMQVDAPFLGRIKIGLFKMESGLRLEGWQDRLKQSCIEHAGEPNFTSDWWVWCQLLPEPWADSGLKTFEPSWQLDPCEFTPYCVEKFRQLKSLAPLIETVHQALPILQAVPFKTLTEAPWTSLMVRSAFWEIAERLQKSRAQDNHNLGLEWSYRCREGKTDHEIALAQIYATFRIAHFECKLVAQCDKRRMSFTLESWTPPHFEGQFISAFLNTKFSSFACVDRKNRILSEFKASKDFDNLTPHAWLARFDTFVTTEIERILTLVYGLKTHLESGLSLLSDIQRMLSRLFPSTEGWRILDQTSTLNTPHGGFLIWHTDWLGPYDDDSDAQPLLVFQLGSTSRLFDQLFWAVHTTHTLPSGAAERELGAVIGACDMLFGKGATGEFSWLWWTEAAPAIRQTGFRTLDEGALSAEGREAFLTALETELLKLQALAASMSTANHALYGFNPDIEPATPEA